MLPKFVLGTLIAAALTVGGVVAAEKAKPAQDQGECCARKLACCDKQSACCKAEKKAGCCAKGQKCCAENRACCGTNPPKCCEDGKACCGEVQKDKVQKDGDKIAVKATCCTVKPAAKKACCAVSK
jgi:hypothetical protein